MAVTTGGLDILRLLLQVDTNLVQLQRDINQNATAWLTAAQAQSEPLATIQGAISSAVGEYNRRLGWVQTLAQDATNYPKIEAMLAALGGLTTDAQTKYQQLKTLVGNIAAADVSTYAAIIAGCTSLIAACPLPLSLWPE